MVRGMSMPLFSRLAWSLTCMGLLLVAGCASAPKPSESRASTPPARTVQRNPARDGPPLDAPPNLASLPDAEPQVEPIKPGGPNKPYVVLGQAYEPIAKDVPWKERGVASWYGTKFDGRRTASGELFSMYGLTAAHRTLPIPSYARVRNVRNGQDIIVRINDRGPFHSNRVMDLSYAAAVKLGVASAGSATVEIERLTFDEIRTGAWRKGTLMDPAGVDAAQAAAPVVAPPVALDATVTPTESPSVAPARAYTTAAQGFWVQLAALSKRDGVEQLQRRVATELSALQPLVAVFHEKPLFKLQVGPFATKDEASLAARQVRDTLQLQPMLVQRR
jgi:rare lipoprotein A